MTAGSSLSVYGVLISFMAGSWLVVGCATSASDLINVPPERLANDTYTAQDSGYTITLPPLVKPGARIEERQTGPATQGVFFADDFGKVYYVLRTDNTRQKLTLEQISDDFAVGELLREKHYTTTDRGKELRLVGINKGGSPIVSRTQEKEGWVERKHDLYEAWSIFIRDVHIYQVTAGVTQLHGESENDMFNKAKSNLEGFLKGLSIKQTKQE